MPAPDSGSATSSKNSPRSKNSSRNSSRNSGNTGSSSSPGLEQLEGQLAALDQGDILAPIDEITANGLEAWTGNKPAYHDLGFVNYTKYDVQEWAGRVKKYKLNVCSEGARVRRLEQDVRVLKEKLAREATEFEQLQRDSDAAAERLNDLTTETREHESQLDNLVADNAVLKRHLQEGRRTAQTMAHQSTFFFRRTNALEAEAEQSRKKFENCLGEKERLRLEREWFFKQRIMLEETTTQEERDAVWLELRVRLAKLRHSMHRAWTDAKRDDVRGLLRVAKWGPTREEWYSSRRKMFQPKFVEVQNSEQTSQPGTGEQATE